MSTLEFYKEKALANKEQDLKLLMSAHDCLEESKALENSFDGNKLVKEIADKEDSLQNIRAKYVQTYETYKSKNDFLRERAMSLLEDFANSEYFKALIVEEFVNSLLERALIETSEIFSRSILETVLINIREDNKEANLNFLFPTIHRDIFGCSTTSAIQEFLSLEGNKFLKGYKVGVKPDGGSKWHFIVLLDAN